MRSAACVGRVDRALVAVPGVRAVHVDALTGIALQRPGRVGLGFPVDRIAGMEAMVRALGHLADCCGGDGRPDGPILTDLQTAPPPCLPTRRDTTFGRP